MGAVHSAVDKFRSIIRDEPTDDILTKERLGPRPAVRTQFLLNSCYKRIIYKRPIMKIQCYDNDERLKIIIGTDPHTETIFTDPSALASISPVFRRMLQTPLCEQRTQIIRIEEADSRSFEVLLHLCGVVKTPELRINSVETAVGLLCLGQRYLIREVELPALVYLQ